MWPLVFLPISCPHLGSEGEFGGKMTVQAVIDKPIRIYFIEKERIASKKYLSITGFEACAACSERRESNAVDSGQELSL